MKRWIRVAAHLYPRAWRERYGVEYQALLDDVNAGWREFFNVLGGAMKMQFLRSRASWVVVCGAIGLLVAGAFSYAGREYVSTASVRVVTPSDSGVPATIQIDRLQRTILSYSNLISVVTDPRFNLYRDDRRRGIGLAAIATRMQKDLKIKRDGATVAFSFAYSDQATAQMVANHLSMTFARRLESDNRALVGIWGRFRPGSQPPEPVQIVNLGSATFPDHAIWPKLRSYIPVGLGTGLLLGFAAACSGRSPKRALVMGTFAFVGALLAAGISFLIPDTFTSRAAFVLTPAIIPLEPYDSAAVVRDFREIEAEALSEPRLRSFIHMRMSYNRKTVTEDGLVAQIRGDALKVRLSDPPTGFTIQFSSHDRVVAKQVVDLVVWNFEELYAQREQEKARASGSAEAIHIADAQLGPKCEMYDLAYLPSHPDSPPRLFIAIAGLVLGLLVAALKLSRTLSGSIRPGQDRLGTV